MMPEKKKNSHQRWPPSYINAEAHFSKQKKLMKQVDEK